MLKIAYLLSFCFVFLFFTESRAQFRKEQDFSIRNKKAIRFYQESENFFIRRQYQQAVELLEKALTKEPEFVEAHIRLGTIYRAVGQYDKALGHLEQARKLSEEDEPDAQALFALGELYWQLGRYAEAEQQMKAFLALNPRQPALKNIAQNIVKDAEFAKNQLENPLPFKPEPLPETVNAYELQYFPVLTVDQQNLIFTRRISNAPQHDEDLMISSRNELGEWLPATSISENINSENNEGTSTISADGRTLIFTSCKGRKGYGSCDLFISRKIGDTWSAPENMGGAVNSRNWESQPSLSADGRTLFFVSNRPGGRGGNDIYVSRLTERGEWSQPENIGGNVNTSFDEISPFIHANGQSLYFASNGHVGMGGYDLFMTELDRGRGEWQQPQNLGYPINTHEDQVSLFVTADGREGYYAFEEKRNNRIDRSLIYRFEIPEQIRVQNRSNYVVGRVYDAVTKEPVAAKVTLFDIIDDLIESTVTSDPENGSYFIVLTEGSEYALYVNKTGYLFKSLSFNYGKNNTLEPIEIDVYLQPIQSGVATVLNNIFFETDQFQIQPKSETELQRVISFLQENPEVRIEIAGHTDDVGSAAYNLELSQKRAEAVKEYLVEAGIDPGRLKATGYGQTKPVVPNTSEENRAQNRRIEFSIL